MQGACQPVALEAQATASLTPFALIAPVWHLHVLVGLMLAVTATGLLLGAPALGPAVDAGSLVGAYLPLVLTNVALDGYVCSWALERRVLTRLLASGPYDARRWLVDLGWACGLTLALLGAENALQTWLGLPESIAAHSLIPSSDPQRLAWVFVAAFVAVSEELVYRGYLRRQLAALSGRAWLGVAGQALLFGLAHAEQGGWAVARFAVYGLAFGWVARARRSLLPTTLCHAFVDGLAGLTG